MKRLPGASVAVLVLVVACIAAGSVQAWRSHVAGAAAAAPAEPVPVAQVRTQVPRVQPVVVTLAAAGDVQAGQGVGLGFARAGQVGALSVVVGDAVAKGGTLATLVVDPAARQAWQAAVDAAGLADREVQRQAALLDAHLATQSQLDAAQKAARDAHGALAALEQQGGGSATSALVAPFDGVVTAVSALQGDRVQAGAAILQLGRTDVLRVALGIEPAEQARVHRGTPVIVEPVLGPGRAATPLDLVVDDVQRAVDPKTQLVAAIAVVPRGRAGPLVPGMKVAARLQVDTVTALAVARSAVLRDEQGDYVFQVAGGKAHRVGVTRRVDNGTLVAIDGLADRTSPVVVEGNYELQDGMAVREAR